MLDTIERIKNLKDYFDKEHSKIVEYLDSFKRNLEQILIDVEYEYELIKQERKFPISVTYENWSIDDIEFGDTDDRGFEIENELYSQDDIERMLLEFDIVTNFI